ncbi:MAG: hypothetical protein AB1442_13755 [Nitrospirota bacterium]
MNISKGIFALIVCLSTLLFVLSCGLPDLITTRPTVPAEILAGLLPMEIFITLGDNPDAEHVTSIAESQVSQMYLWVRGQGNYQIPFTLILTMPSLDRLQYGPDFQTDPNGQPVRCGNMTLPLMPGDYRLEVVIAGLESPNSILEFSVTP